MLISVLLAPHGASTWIEGVALQLLAPGGEPLSARVLLPISGDLRHPMLSTLELIAHTEPIPQGSRVSGTAWAGTDQIETTVPTDPFTELEVHMRARRRIDPDGDDRDLRLLSAEERALIAQDFPWIDEPRLPLAVGELGVVEGGPSEEEALDELIGELGIDEESAEWLKELLEEEE
ncbi:MAG TPA: hypothetical protein ENK18_02945 [Deltaproteobacteria bacterium]|nr:hypothetical protein [Deltaproteobacteria bacterium]